MIINPKHPLLKLLKPKPKPSPKKKKEAKK